MCEQAATAVVIPAYRSPHLVGAAVCSVLGQRAPVPIEVIVIDDGSGDGTADAARQAAAGLARADPNRRSLTVVERDHGGAGAARNAGVDLARAPFLAFLDADDVWPAHSLHVRIDALRADAAIDAVFGRMTEFDDETGAERDPVPAFSAGAMLIRASAFRRVGRFDERWVAGEFIDWFARAEDVGLRTVMLDAVVLRRRIHAGNSTRHHAARRSYAAVLSEIRRRRITADPATAQRGRGT